MKGDDKMEGQAIVNAISSIGFPIVMCLILVWYIKSTHEKLIEAIQSLTQAVIKLETRIDTIEDQTRGEDS